MAFESFEVAIAEGQSAQAVEEALRAHGAIRTKGIVKPDSRPARVQRVGRRIEITPPPGPVADAMLGRVVVIRRVE